VGPGGRRGAEEADEALATLGDMSVGVARDGWEERYESDKLITSVDSPWSVQTNLESPSVTSFRENSSPPDS